MADLSALSLSGEVGRSWTGSSKIEIKSIRAHCLLTDATRSDRNATLQKSAVTHRPGDMRVCPLCLSHLFFITLMKFEAVSVRFGPSVRGPIHLFKYARSVAVGLRVWIGDKTNHFWMQKLLQMVDVTLNL